MKTNILLAIATALVLSIQPAIAAEADKSADVFSKIDKGGKGKITKEEWLAYFSELCKDGDNVLTRSEWDEAQATQK